MTDAYLNALGHAVRDLPTPIANDIVEGVREELRGLDEISARRRIDELGDPLSIAASAREELVPRRLDASGYTVLTIVLIAIGGIVIPVLGWGIGVAMLWSSRTWERRDKLVGTLVLPIALAVSALVGAALLPLQGAPNPLVPTSLQSAMFCGFVVSAIGSSVYLASRARRLSRHNW